MKYAIGALSYLSTDNKITLNTWTSQIKQLVRYKDTFYYL